MVDNIDSDVLIVFLINFIYVCTLTKITYTVKSAGSQLLNGIGKWVLVWFIVICYVKHFILLN